MLIYEHKLNGTPAHEAAIDEAIRFWRHLTVLEPGEEKAPAQELTADLLSLIASFSGRLYGIRSHQQKELMQCAQAVNTNP